MGHEERPTMNRLAFRDAAGLIAFTPACRAKFGLVRTAIASRRRFMLYACTNCRPAQGKWNATGLGILVTAATSPITTDTFLAFVQRSGVADPERLEACLQRGRRAGINSDNPKNPAATV